MRCCMVQSGWDTKHTTIAEYTNKSHEGAAKNPSKVVGREKAVQFNPHSSEIPVSVLLANLDWYTCRQGTRMWREVSHLLAAEGSKGRERSWVFVVQCELCSSVHKMHEFTHMPNPNTTYVEIINSLFNALVHWLHWLHSH